MAKTIITLPFQAAFPKLDEAANFKGQGPLKYSVLGLIPKNATGKKFKAEIEDFIQKSIQATDWKVKIKEAAIKATLKNKESDFLIFKDGDKKNIEDYPFFENHYIINIKRNQTFGPVPCYMQDKSVIPESLLRAEIYGGCWIRASIGCYCYELPKPGASLNLIELQKVKEGEPFRKSAFDEIEVEETEMAKELVKTLA